MDIAQPGNNEVYRDAERLLAERMQWVSDALALLGAEGNDPLAVFHEAGEVRDDGKAVVQIGDEARPINPEEATQLREVAARFGIGGERDIVSTAEHQLLEGGKPWKIEAELAITEAASTVLFAASPFRKIGSDEAEYMLEKYGVDLAGKSEYDVARLIAERADNFEPLENEEVLPFGYDIDNDFALTEQETGQLVRIGAIGDKQVVMVRVDREDYTDETTGKQKYRKQPSGARLMQFVANVLSQSGDDESKVGIVSSNTYASREIDTVIAGIGVNRSFTVGMYGRETLAAVRGEAVAEPVGIHQIPGELRTIYSKLLTLQAALEQ